MNARLFEALTGIESLPSSISVGGRDFSVITDYRDWCMLDTVLVDRDMRDTDKGAYILHFFWPAVTKGEIELVDGVFPFTVDDAREGIIDFWMAAREMGSGTGRGTKPSRERSFDYIHDIGLIYAAFRQVYSIDLAQAGAMHWWTFYALFCGIPEGTVFEAAKQARTMKLEDYSNAEARAKMSAIKEAWALPENIRYYSGGGKTMTDQEFKDYVRKRHAEALASVK